MSRYVEIRFRGEGEHSIELPVLREVWAAMQTVARKNGWEPARDMPDLTIGNVLTPDQASPFCDALERSIASIPTEHRDVAAWIAVERGDPIPSTVTAEDWLSGFTRSFLPRLAKDWRKGFSVHAPSDPDELRFDYESQEIETDQSSVTAS